MSILTEALKPHLIPRGGLEASLEVIDYIAEISFKLNPDSQIITAR